MSYLVEQTPLEVGELDESAIHFHPTDRQWRPVDIDYYYLTAERNGSLDGLGQEPCPPCSYHSEGRCNWCPDDVAVAQTIPECADCEGREKVQEPWYRREDIMVPVLTTATVTVIATVLSTIILARIGMKEAA